MRCERRRQVWVTPPSHFDPRGYSVDVIERETAVRPFVCEHHYAGSWPAAQLSVGIFAPNADLVGAAVFAVPMNQKVVPAYTGLAPHEGTTLGRFVLLPSLAFNAETWFLARALKFVREETGARAVVSYADPLERRDASNAIAKRAHWGTIYQASNATYAGAGSPRTLLLAPNGTVVCGRALSKIRRHEKGWEYATRQLIDAAASPRQFGESPAEWVTRVTATFRKIRHPGNLVYVFGLDRAAERSIRTTVSPKTYPRAAAA